MKQATTRVCTRCKTPVWEEHDEEITKEYPYYCPNCDENMFTFETEISDKVEKGSLKFIGEDGEGWGYQFDGKGGVKRLVQTWSVEE